MNKKNLNYIKNQLGLIIKKIKLIEVQNQKFIKIKDKIKINNLIKDIKSEKYIKIAEFIEDENDQKEFMEILKELNESTQSKEEIKEKLYEYIGNSISGKNDINYFVEQCVKFDVVNVLTKLNIKSTVSCVKTMIKDKEKYRLSKYDIQELIQSTKDDKYIKECIDNREKLGLSDYVVGELVKSIKEERYIKECIKDMEKLKLSTYEIMKMLQSIKDDKYIKECIEDREKLKLSIYDVQILIEMTENIEYIKEYINDRKKLGLPKYFVEKLIPLTKDNQYIKECIENRVDFGLSMFDVRMLIIETKDVELQKECVKDRKKLGLSTYDLMKLIQLIEDKEYIKKCVEEWNELGLSSEDSMCLIKSTKDEEYIKKCIKNKKKLGLERKEIIYLIKSTEDEEYIKKCIKDRESLEITSEDIFYLIQSIEDEEYIKKCIENRDELKLTEKTIAKILMNMDNKTYVKEQYLKLKGNLNVKKINLPSNMTIGIEIECENVDFRMKGTSDWIAKRDGSLINGTELVSPIITSNSEQVENIYLYNDLIQKMGGKIFDRCGGHVHIGANYLTSAKSYENLMDIWCNSEKIMYLISNEAGNVTREKAIRSYACPISTKVQKCLKEGNLNLESEQDLKEYISNLQNIQESRYSAINFMNSNDENKKTIEFRISNGTINPDAWIENINLFGGIVVASEELHIIQKKPEKLRTAEDIRKLELLDEIMTAQVTDKEMLQLVLELAVNQEDRQLYEKRFELNSKLVIELGREKLYENLNKDKINLSPKKMVRKVINNIDGIDIENTEEELSRAISNEQKEVR